MCRRKTSAVHTRATTDSGITQRRWKKTPMKTAIHKMNIKSITPTG